MNKEIVIAIAHEASPDMTWYAAIENPDQASPEELAFLMRFAALVEQRTHTNNKARWYQEGVEAERNRIADESKAIIKRAEARGASIEREACAKVCRSEADRALWNFQNDLPQNESFWNGAEQMASSCENAIRARGNT
jgi:hypothetical protein